MNCEEALNLLKILIDDQGKKRLTSLQEKIIQQSWEGRSYNDMEISGYSSGYIKTNFAPQLWQLLSEVIGQPISKKNLKIVLAGLQEGRLSDLSGTLRAKVEDVPSTESEFGGGEDAIAFSHQDWGEAPDVSVFYGRTAELTTLHQWIVTDRCRVVALLGMGGIGKTALSVKLASQMLGEFEYVIWRSLRYAPPVEEILADIINFLCNEQETDLLEDQGKRISQLIEYLRKHRCLLILDDWETVLRGGELAGHYREGYEGYGELLRRVGESPPQSCLVLTSREKPQEIALLAGKTLPVRYLELNGLQTEDAKRLLSATGLSSLENGLEELIQRYAGNPAALRIISTTIQELFNGNVSKFIEQSTLLVGDILTNLLSQQFSRLSELEKEIMYWLAIEQKPVSTAKLKSNIWLSVALSELLMALESLRGRSLIEKATPMLIEQISDSGESLFTLQPVVMKYVTRQLIAQVCKDIFAFVETQELTNMGLLRSLELIKEQKGEPRLKATQVRLIINPIKNKLSQIYSSERSIEEQLNDILGILREKSPQAVGYAVNNVLHLLGRT